MDLGKRPIIVTDRDYFPLLFSFRAKNPGLAFTLLSTEDLRSRLGVNFVSSPLPTLMKQGLDYVEAKKWMRILSFGVAELHPMAKRLFASLPKEILRQDELGFYELSHAEVYFLELHEDIELHALLSRHGLVTKDITLEELGLSPVTDLQGLKVTLFQNKYEQFDAIFSALRKRYLSAGEKEIHPSDVRLYVQDEGDAFYLQLLGREFGIPVRMEVSSPLLAVTGVSDLVASIYEKGSIALSEEEKESEAGKIVQGIIEEFALPELPFDLAYASLLEILEAKKQTSSLSEAGVIASSSSVFSPEKEIFLTCLQHGPFYSIYSDDDVLADDELLSLGINPSYVKTQLEQRKKKNFLAYHRFALLSRVKQHLGDKIYPSGFAKEYGWAKEVPAAPSGTYSDMARKNRVMTEIDRAFYVKPIGEYHGYDSSFQGIQGFVCPKGSFSVTNLESYRSCPYRYYLNMVLPKQWRDYRPSFVGTMVHKVLENVYAPDYDLEKALEQGKQTYYAERAKANVAAIPFDDILVESTLASLKNMLPLVLAQKEVAHISEQWSEERVRFVLSDEKGSYPFTGSVDNILRFEAGQSHYLVINDYKTGGEKFRVYECFLGRSTQLPLYYFALQNGSHGKEKTPLLDAYPSLFAGMGIKKVGFDGISQLFTGKDKSVLSLGKGYESLASVGVYSSDLGFWDCADTHQKETQYGIKGRFYAAGKSTFDLSGNGSLSMIPGGAPYGLDELVQDAVKGTLDVIHAILDGEFPLAPTSSDLRDAPSARNITCKYCQYRDICYRNLGRDAKDYSAEVAKKFKKGGNVNGL